MELILSIYASEQQNHPPSPTREGLQLVARQRTEATFKTFSKAFGESSVAELSTAMISIWELQQDQLTGLESFQRAIIRPVSEEVEAMLDRIVGKMDGKVPVFSLRGLE